MITRWGGLSKAIHLLAEASSPFLANHLSVGCWPVRNWSYWSLLFLQHRHSEAQQQHQCCRENLDQRNPLYLKKKKKWWNGNGRSTWSCWSCWVIIPLYLGFISKERIIGKWKYINGTVYSKINCHSDTFIHVLQPKHTKKGRGGGSCTCAYSTMNASAL